MSATTELRGPNGNPFPVIELAHLIDAERRSYLIADNQVAELAGWDSEILAIQLPALSEMEMDLELEITGFETAETDLLRNDDNWRRYLLGIAGPFDLAACKTAPMLS